MAGMTSIYVTAYGAASVAALCVAASAFAQRFSAAPIAAAHVTPNLVDRKADGRVPPRGRRL